MKLFQTIKSALAAPFKWGYQCVDTRPPGSAYRRVATELHAVETGKTGEVAFVVGNGLTEKRPIMETIQAATPAEAANATLALVGKLRRSQARAIHSAHKTIVAEKRKADKAAQAAAAAGNESTGSTGSLIPSSAVSGQAGEPAPVLVPA